MAKGDALRQGVPVEDRVEEDAPFVKGDGQAEGGEGDMQRLPLLVDHQRSGYRDAHRCQHEDFHGCPTPSLGRSVFGFLCHTVIPHGKSSRGKSAA
jgi:hypothetical protein